METLAHYQILKTLGKGGMGEVYLAKDLKLERTVALKVLPSHTSLDKDRIRQFTLEAKAASSVTHPNICVIYEVGESEDGRPFISMEHVEGQTLSVMIQNQPFEISRILEIAIQTAEALDAAHRKNIIHRDIKPANIMITTAGQVKLLDFGLAKIIKVRDSLQFSNDSTDAKSQAGEAKGTVPFMSPEQVLGKDIDHRTDIFSFGIVLYLMLAGKLPFAGRTITETIDKIIHAEPDSIFNRQISPELERIIKKCLAKDPGLRYQSAHDVWIDLKNLQQNPTSAYVKTHKKNKKLLWLQTAVSFVLLIGLALTVGYFYSHRKFEETGKISIAVVDFINETGDKDLDGLSGLLITDLEQSGRLKVLTRSRMFDILRRTNRNNIEQIDEQSGRMICNSSSIPLLAIGNVKKFGQVYTIDLKVIDIEKDEHLFATKANGKGKEAIPSLIDEIADYTRSQLKETSANIHKANKQIAQITTPNLEAYGHFFQGEQLVSNSKFLEAAGEFQKAVEIDPDFALGYYRLSYSLWAHRELSSSKGAIDNALRLINRVPQKERMIIRAMSAHIRGNKDEAFSLYKEYLKKYPDDKEVLYLFGDFAHHQGDYQTAIPNLEKVLSIDPDFERASQHLIWAYRAAKQNDQALRVAKAWNTRAGNEHSYFAFASCYSYNGDFNNALKVYQEAIPKFPKSHDLISGLGFVYLIINEFEKAETEFKKLIPNSLPEIPDQAYGYRGLTFTYLYTGEYHEALKTVDKRELIYKKAGLKSALAELDGWRAYVVVWGWNDRKRAKEWLTKSLESNEEYDTYFLFRTSLLLGDYDQASRLATMDLPEVYEDLQVKAYSKMNEGDYYSAIKLFKERLEKVRPVMTTTDYYDLSECYLRVGLTQEAIKAVKQLQKNHNGYDEDRAILYPRTFYLLGKIYEKEGNWNLAIENYKKFLTLWKDADEDLPILIDAKARFAKLQ